MWNSRPCKTQSFYWLLLWWLCWGSSEKSSFWGTGPLSVLSPCRTATAAPCTNRSVGEQGVEALSALRTPQGALAELSLLVSQDILDATRTTTKKNSAKLAGWGCLRAAQAHRSRGAAVAAVPPALPRPPADVQHSSHGATELSCRAPQEQQKTWTLGFHAAGPVVSKQQMGRGTQHPTHHGHTTQQPWDLNSTHCIQLFPGLLSLQKQCITCSRM